MNNEIAIKLVRDACSKQSEDGKFVLYEQDIELIAQGFQSIVRAKALEEAEERVTELYTNMEFPFLPDITAAIRGLK